MTTIFEDNGENNGMPWWVKAIGLIGVPSAIAIFWTVVSATDVRAGQVKMNENLALLAIQVTKQSEQDIKVIHAIENLKRSMDRICANTAKNYTERNECFR